MTPERVEALRVEACPIWGDAVGGPSMEQIFARLVANEVREECAKAIHDSYLDGVQTEWTIGYNQALKDVADGIRATKEQQK